MTESPVQDDASYSDHVIHLPDILKLESADLDLGDVAPLDQAIPELAAPSVPGASGPGSGPSGGRVHLESSRTYPGIPQ